MNRNVVGVVIWTFATASCYSVAPDRHGQPRHYEITMLYGERSLDDDDWEPFDSQEGAGFVFSWGKGESGLRYELGFSAASERSPIFTVDGPFMEDVSFVGRTAELFAGVRYEFEFLDGRVRPYVGLGAVHGRSTIQSFPRAFDPMLPPPPPKVHEKDDSLGGYAHAGIEFPVINGPTSVSFGANYRTVFGTDYDVTGSSLDGQFDQLSLTLSLSF